jgi:hypothetical protein
MILNRRQVIANMALGTSTLALTPLLQQVRAEQTTGGLPKRFVFVVKSSGYYPDDIQPEGLEFTPERMQDNSIDEVRLPAPMAPLLKHRDQLTVIRGLSAKMSGGGHHGFYGALGCYLVKGATTWTSNPPLAATIDCVLGSHLPSIYDNLGFFPMTNKSLVTPAYISAPGPRVQMPFYDSPDLAYNNLFGVALEGDNKTDYELQGDLMDFMVDDVRRVSKRLVGNEKEKLDRYVANFESMRKRRTMVERKRDLLRKHVPEKDDRYINEESTLEERLHLSFEMTATALISGLTNVVTLRTCNIGARYDGELGLTALSVHGIGHGGEGVEGVDAIASRQRIKTFHYSLISELADKLRAMPEGDGTMLDNTVILYMSDGGNAHHGDTSEVPRILVGGKNILKNNGRYLQYPAWGNAGHQTSASLYLAMLHGIGQPQKQFGRLDTNLGAKADQHAPLHELVI